MADQNVLTPDEASFFETGELPTNLAAEQAANLAAQEAAAAAEAAATQAEADAATLAAAAAQPQPITQQPVQQDQTEFLRQALLQEQQNRIALQQQLAQLQTTQQKTTESPPPDPETDPLGAMMHQLANVNNTVANLQAKLLEQQQIQSQTEGLLNFQASMKAVRDDFVKATPDFDAAYTHLRSVRADDMRTVGIPDAKIQQILLQDEIAIAQIALQTGKNPAAVMYDMAKRHGYAPTAQQQAAAQGKPTSKVDLLQAGMAAAKQPQAAAQPAENLTMAGLKQASDSDLDKLVQSDDAWAKLTGSGGKSIF